jgi:hypothetical protein
MVLQLKFDHIVKQKVNKYVLCMDQHAHHARPAKALRTFSIVHFNSICKYVLASSMDWIACYVHNELGTLHTYFEAYFLNFQFHVFMLPETFRRLISTKQLYNRLTGFSNVIVEPIFFIINFFRFIISKKTQTLWDFSRRLGKAKLYSLCFLALNLQI